MKSVVRAAGGVVTRAGREGAEILLVHRPRYDDWTLPKGKAEAGESDEDCALREVEEETGLACELGPEVAVSEYEDAGREAEAGAVLRDDASRGSRGGAAERGRRRSLADAGARARDAEL